VRERKRRWFLRLVAAAALFALCIWQGRMIIKQSFTPTRQQEVRVILDAGHGGEDGGAVSPAGVKESEVNLSIVLRTEQVMGFLGEPPLLLRTEDVSLHDADAATLREKKVSDLKNRAARVSALPQATLVSIHQNSYPEPQYRGAQVFYAPTNGSQQLASRIQDELIRKLQPDNTRQEKQVPEGVYLMNHISNRAILAECGFLTNPEEEKLLTHGDYQKKLSVILGVTLVTHPER